MPTSLYCDPPGTTTASGANDGVSALTLGIESCGTCNEGWKKSATGNCDTCQVGYTCSTTSSSSVVGIIGIASPCTIANTGLAGTINCVNSGTVAGVTNACMCVCPVGYSGTTCETALPCTIANTGLAGTIECQNSATAGGVTNVCTCVCPAGVSGTTCEILDDCLVAATGLDGTIACENGGVASGTTGSCTCVCRSGFEGHLCGVDLESVVADTTTALQVCNEEKAGNITIKNIKIAEIEVCNEEKQVKIDAVAACDMRESAMAANWTTLKLENDQLRNNWTNAMLVSDALQIKLDAVVVERNTVNRSQIEFVAACDTRENAMAANWTMLKIENDQLQNNWTNAMLESDELQIKLDAVVVERNTVDRSQIELTSLLETNVNELSKKTKALEDEQETNQELRQNILDLNAALVEAQKVVTVATAAPASTSNTETDAIKCGVEECDVLLVKRTGFDSGSMMVFGFGFFVYVVTMTVVVLVILIKKCKQQRSEKKQQSDVNAKVQPKNPTRIQPTPAKEKSLSQRRMMDRLEQAPKEDRRAMKRRSRADISGVNQEHHL